MNQNEESIAILLSQLKETMPYFMRMEKLNLLRDLSKKENKTDVLRATCRGQIKLINAHMKDLKDDEKLKAYNFLRDAHTDNGRYDLESYLIAMEWDRKPEKRFYQPRMKVLHPVMKDLQDLGDGVIDIYLLSMPPRIGKLVSDNTPVLTSKGWKNHGDLQVGDIVFSPDGKNVKVTHVFPKNVANIEVTFSNGEKIKCHENHEWVVYDRSNSKLKTVETKYMMARKLYTGEPNKRGHRYIFQLPQKAPFEGVKQDLKVDPYVLGAWLGDGHNQHPKLAYAEQDKVVFETFVEKEYIVSNVYVHPQTNVRYAYFTKLREQLQQYGMCFSRKKTDKYIPQEYLCAPIKDRLELLAGLLDTDGTLSRKEKRYHYSTTSEKLKDGIVQLISTFGWRCNVTEYEPTTSSSGIHGRLKVYNIGFNPTFYIPCRVERKQLHEFSKQRRISIINIEKCEEEQGNCISVEGGLYCVGETMLPTHNSTIGLFFMSWLAGRYPNEHIFGAGYASGLVNTFCKGVLDFIDSEEYRFYEIFPEARGKLTTSAKDMTIDIWENERYKTLTFRSIDGQITGALEAESLLYLDDMCSGIEEAMNIDRLEKLWSKVTVDLMQRRVMNKRTGRLAPILGIGTIWSVHDPISRLERKYGKTKRFRSRKMPALNLDGESNFDYDYNVGYTTAMYQELKSNMDEVSWECVYQQNPMERDGLLFPGSELRRYLSLPNTKPDAIIAHCDVAFGGDDFINFPVGYVYGEDCYVVDTVFRCKADYKVTEPMVAGKIVQHEVQMAHFEADRGGDFYARDVDDMVKKGSKHRCNITWSPAGTKQSKLVRIIQYAPDIKRMYFKDPSLYKPTDDYGRMMSNVTTFVQTGSSLHDDGPDGLAGLAKLFKQPMIGAVSSPFKRPF